MKTRYKRGFTREDGMMFWMYNSSCRNNEWWVTPDHFWRKKKKVSEDGKKQYAFKHEHKKLVSRNYRLKNKEELRNKDLYKKYGITLEDYNAILLTQKSVCAMCKKPCVSGRNLAVDHCHKTGKVRGLLCCNCNRAIGLLKDCPNVFDMGSTYLKKNS